MTVKVRFAPSPTGKLHVGNIRTALVNWLFAKGQDGVFVLRIDDTDLERSTKENEDGIRNDLTWLGMTWDETFKQSERFARYTEAAEELKAKGLLYPCYETPEELERRKKIAQSRGKPPVYDRAALELTDADRKELEAQGRKPHWRFKLSGGRAEWVDLVRGQQSIDTSSVSDPVLIREDGSFLYTMPSVVDDVDAKITHVIRGEDHVTNSGAQIEIFLALGAKPPEMAHMPLLIGADGQGLSKRLGSLSAEQLRAEGYELTKTHDGADAVIVNTCGFLDSAKAESLAAIGEALNENGKVIVTGCMGAEPEAITAAYPGVLAITGPQAYESVMNAVHQAVPPKHDPFLDLVPEQGIKLTPRHYAYLKISEGCNNRCTFCIIPKLRGDLVSRSAADVLREAEKLVAAGVKELLVVSQDTSAYGVDVKYAESQWKDRAVRAKFLDLARELGSLGAWVRLHYVYPYPHVDDVIPLMAEGLVLPYLDIPFQHASQSVLKAMKRPASQDKVLERIGKWREICPDLAIRSTFIVGFPGETEENFQELLDFLDEAKLERVGCFKYEPVKGAPANDLGLPLVPDEVKQDRYDRFMKKQQAISAKRLASRVGRRIKVIIDEPGATVAKGRSQWDAPEIDGNVYVASRRPLRQGDIVSVKIERADAYDLRGTAV